MSRLLAATRYLAIIPVVCILLAAVALTLFGAASTLQLLVSVAVSGKLDSKAGKELLLRSIELVDIFLLGTVLYVTAIGLYELFIDDTIAVPDWLEIHTLDDLKDRLIGVVIVVLGVLFLGQVITWDGQRDLLAPGVAIALVIGALAFFLGKKVKG